MPGQQPDTWKRTWTRAAAWGMLGYLCGALQAWAEGSRTLYPATYPTGAGTCANVANRGCRANLDLQPGTRYVGKIQRRTFLYVYAEAGEYILLGSSNRGTGGDILVYLPQDFGTPGDETLPAVADFSCASASPPAGSFSGGSRGQLNTRAQEVAGPHSVDGTATAPGGFAPCGYQVPVSGIYGVQFMPASSGATNLNGDVFNPRVSSSTAAAWDVTVRASAGSLTDLNGRLFTYAWVGFTGINNRPVYSRHDYVTLDGFRYAQSLAGLDPNGFALYANRLGFLDNGQPFYKGVRGSDSLVTNLAPGLSAQRPEFPIFFSSVAPSAPHAAEVDKVLTALRIPLVPEPPSLSSIAFIGPATNAGAHTWRGAGGTFRLAIHGASTFRIVVSRDGVDFSPSNTANAVITGIAGTGTQEVRWDGNDAMGTPFPASTTPYAYRAQARAGEIHLPMIDTENNGNGTSTATATFGGGPTVTKLNGPQAGDTTVYFDDRGYVTQGGTLVGQVNGTLCPASPPPAPSPTHALGGVDSTLAYGASPRLYRWWPPGSNANSDCAAAGGWGDAKGLDLWTYISSPEANGVLWVDPLLRDVAAELFVPGAARPGSVVQGRLAFANHGADPATGLQYTLALDHSCAGLALGFANLPAGATVQCVDTAGQGLYTFAGFPSTLAGNASVSGANPAAPITFSYTAPASGSVSAVAVITGAGPDDVPANNTASGVTVISAVDLQTSVSAPLTALAGDTVSALVSFANFSGASAASWTSSITVGSPLGCPAAVELFSAPPGISMAGYDTTTCAVTLSGLPPALADGQILSLTFRFRAPTLGRVTILTTVDTAGDAHTGNNSASATTTVSVVDMLITLAGLPSQAVPGRPYAGTFSCTNIGVLDAVGATRCAIDSGLPPGLSLGACVLDRTGGTWVAGDAIPAGATVTCSVQGTPATAGEVVVLASTGATGDVDLSNNSAMLVLAVVVPQAIPALTPHVLAALAALLVLATCLVAFRRHGAA